MKLKTLSLLVAGICGAAFAGSALALPVSQYQATAGDTLELFISGATAQENGLRRTVSRLCQPGSLDIYRFSNQEAQFCTINKTLVTGLPTSVTKMVVYKSGVGGSGNGIQPVADATNLAFISMAALKANPALVSTNSTTVPAVAPSAPDTIGIPAYTTTLVATTATQSVAPEAGFSDVEPALLGATAAQNTRLQVTAPNVLIFGVPVTVAARNALQAAQGLTVGAEDETNMPSLSSALLSSVYTGNISSWSQLGVTLADDTIYLATRVETSGTQKSFNAVITGGACSRDVQTVLLNNSTEAQCSAPTPVGTVFAGSGSGNVLNCMAGHNSRNRGAFGVLSMEFVPGAPGAGTGYRFIKIDGWAPTLVNVVNGNYTFWVEPTFQYRKSPAPNPLTGNKKILADRIVAQLGSEAVISSLNSSFVQSWGPSGLLAKPSAANPPLAIVPPATPAQVQGNPTNAFTRSPTGTPLNCQKPVLWN